ncbi:class IV lanthionine synthetase LanL [Sphaerisporangium dianthi]|uniref:non-specific serine/threonine protein kinase n=1 Tax=Sphaerisporangium dianthi TaxID=1436120 RepID=A0ABV9CUU6_9ACTN
MTGETILPDIVRAVLAREGAGGWRVEPGEFWCSVRREAGSRAQGWKLHLSATPLSAPLVLGRAAAVLARHGCPFKFAGTLERVAELTSPRYDRAGGGKFITAYPDVDDERLRELAGELHRATEGLPGPGILSDRPYRPGSLVHYRYGAFRGLVMLGNDGSREAMLVAPDGSLVLDERKPWYSPPPWAPRDPFVPSQTAPGGPRTPPARPAPPAPASAAPAAAPAVMAPAGEPSERDGGTVAAVLLGGRYVVRKAIRHALKGGVFEAVDDRTGAPVIVKQARRHVGATPGGLDVRDTLRHEAAMLELMEPSGVTPLTGGLFEQQGDLFLVQQSIAGVTLREWVHANTAFGEDGLWGPPPADAQRLASELARLVALVHAQGLVLQDFNPNNVMVTEDGGLRLIDLELLARPGEPAMRACTPGYGAPEQGARPGYGPAPELSADLYGLGATLFHLATGADPHLPADDPPGRTSRGRLGAWLAHMSRGNPAAARLAPLILALLEEDPGRRPALGLVRRTLASPPASTAPPASAGGPAAPADPPLADGPASASGPALAGDSASAGGPALFVAPAPSGVPSWAAVPPARIGPDESGRADIGQGEDDLGRLLDDGLAHLVASMNPSDPERLWPTGGFGRSTDPFNVQHGAAGVLGVLVRAYEARPDPELREAVAAAAGWIGRRVLREPRMLPGLYFGRSGTAWALLEAGRVLGDEELDRLAADLALRVPVRWPNPDICHGMAGAGMTQLRFWEVTGREVFLSRARQAAASVAEAAVRVDGRLLWPVPRDFASTLAGLTHYGFAHGVAGTGAFLLAAGRALGEPAYGELAAEAAGTLTRVARVEDDAAYWPSGEGDDRLLTHWCSGSSGVGTFLVRMWRETGDETLLRLVSGAAVAIHRSRWHADTGQCHGLSGDAEFLLDLAQAGAGERHRGWALDLATAIYLRHALRDGRMVIAPDKGTQVFADFNVGLSGVVALLLRLRDGGPRMWLPEVLAGPAAP